MTNRLLKINSEIQKELSKIISYKLVDPRLSGTFITILNVDTSPDISHCKINISVFPEEKREEALSVIKKCSSFLRKELAKNIKLRIIPELQFMIDKGYEHEEHINQLLKGIKNDWWNKRIN